MSRLSPKKKPAKVERAAAAAAAAAPASGGGNLTFKVLVILLAGLFIYAPVFHGGWLWDDDQEITASQVLPDPNGLVKIWKGEAGADYFPLKTTVQWLFFRVNGANPTGWHLLNISLHLVCALLVWRLFERLGIRQAWLGGLLFCIHPILAESVGWVSELKNTLSLAILLFSMLAWVAFDERKKESDYWWAIVFFIAAILCKTSVVMFPFVLLLYCWWKRGKIDLHDILRSVPFFLISLVMGLVTIHFQFGRAIGTETIPVGGMLSRTATAGMAILFYFYKCVWPFGLLPIYPRWEVDPPSLWQFLPWPVIAAVLFWLWTKRNTWGRDVLFGLGFFLINLFPILGFITMSYMRITWVADHFVYLPILGLIGLATWTAGYAYEKSEPEPRRYLFGLGLVIFTVLTIHSHRYAGIFVNEYEMWTHTLKSNPNAWQAHSRLGKTMLERGDNDAAFFHISESVRLRPDLAETHNNYGAMLEKKGDIEGALEQLRTAVRIEPRVNVYRVNLGSLLVRMGKYQEGSEVYETLLQSEPGNPTFLCNYGVSLFFLGRNDEAIDNFQKALKVNPDLKDARENLAAALKKKSGQTDAPAAQPQVPAPGAGLIDSGSAVKLFGN
ncbi:MAG: tetratricopeptide repeat protein [Terrimicrobiaceae bacterium]